MSALPSRKDEKGMSFLLSAHSRVHFVGIGGISMSALALIMKRRGYRVTGYDLRRTPATQKLEAEGIEISYTADEKLAACSDLCVYSAAIHDDHPELVAARAAGAEMVSRAELLGTIAKDYSNSIAIAGTHGKSTTSGMLSQIFLSCESADPTILVGAELPALHSTFRTGSDGNFIFEACEYKDSFLSFYPTMCIVLNVELDHTDYFHDIDQMRRSFTQFLRNSQSKTAVVNADCPNALKAAEESGCELHTFSLKVRGGEFYPENMRFENGHAVFILCRIEKRLFEVSLSVPGIHNVSNALAASAAALISGVPADAICRGLSDFTGVCRRFEYKGLCNGARVYDDYAHHPDEVRATLDAAKGLGASRIVVAFEPHTYSRLHDFLHGFASVLRRADVVCIAPVYAARETETFGCNSGTLAALIPGARAFENYETLEQHLRSVLQAGDIMITMGAGDVTHLAAALTSD